MLLSAILSLFLLGVMGRLGDLKLKPDSEDNLETREKVKNILSRMKPALPIEKTKLKREPVQSSMETIEFPPYNRKTIHIPEVNKNISEWMYEGDMMLTVEQATKIAEGQGSKAKRAATTDPNYYWDPSTPIYYTIDQSIQNDQTKLPLVNAAVQYWQTNTCLNLQNSNGPNMLNYYIGSGCWSYVGKQPGWTSQQISIGNGCESLGTVTHETAHALGFYHEQSRYDRDDYVSINMNNIDPALQYNFVKMTQQTSNNLGVPYDFGSVMQYDAYAFASNTSELTIIPRDRNYINTMGQREEPAFSDVISVNALYNCSQQCTTKPNCQNSGIVNSRKCNECLCPHMFTGPTCTGLSQGNAKNCNGQVIQATSSSWTTFNGTAGDPSDYNPLTTPNDCYWLVQAPQGKKLQFQVTQTAMCQDQCHWQAFDINLGNFMLGGMLLCCPTTVFSSTSNQISIRGLSYYNQLRFSFQYRVVD